MKRLDISAWPAFLERQRAALPAAMAAALTAIGASAAGVAREKIGHYQPAADGLGLGFAFPEWEPLAPSTLAEKERLGYAPPDNPLLRTGELRSSISYFTDGARLMVFGTADPIAVYQELGTAHMLPRPFIGPTMVEIEPVVRRELGRALVATLSGGKYQPTAEAR